MAKIIIIENDLELVILYRAALKFQSHEILTTGTITEGLATISTEKPALALVDTNCPDFDKFESYKLNIPLFLLTNLPEKESLALAKKYGAHYTLNPLDGSISGLIHEVRRVLN